MQQTGDHRVTTLEALEALYDKPYGPAIVKEIAHINAHYRKFIEAAPFFALATSGPDGLDCSPRGDAPGFVRVADEKTRLFRTAAATIASIPCATSSAIRAWPCCFLSPASARQSG
jgi:predicted pyridoxine 5'-phosphate oxidase superfamily flavin-nucleotide-binding protein